MGKVKLKNEKATMYSFIFVSLVILTISAVFFFLSLKKEELGGILITSMFLFMSGYAFIVFILRALRYGRITKIQKAVLEEQIYSIEELKEHFSIPDKILVKDLKFMLNNGYLGSLKIYNGRLIDEEAELLKAEQAKRDALIRYNEKLKANGNNQNGDKSRKKKIVSEKCPNCGAKVDFVNGEAQCPYCGNSLNVE